VSSANAVAGKKADPSSMIPPAAIDGRWCGDAFPAMVLDMLFLSQAKTGFSPQKSGAGLV
jgi:hypothetical protein